MTHKKQNENQKSSSKIDTRLVYEEPKAQIINLKHVIAAPCTSSQIEDGCVTDGTQCDCP